MWNDSILPTIAPIVKLELLLQHFDRLAVAPWQQVPTLLTLTCPNRFPYHRIRRRRRPAHEPAAVHEVRRRKAGSTQPSWTVLLRSPRLVLKAQRRPIAIQPRLLESDV